MNRKGGQENSYTNIKITTYVTFISTNGWAREEILFKPSDKEEAKTLKVSKHFMIMTLTLFMLDLAFSNHVKYSISSVNLCTIYYLFSTHSHLIYCLISLLSEVKL